MGATTAEELIDRLLRIGAKIEANGEKLCVLYPDAHRRQVEELRPDLERLKPQVLLSLSRPQAVQTRMTEPGGTLETRWNDPSWRAAMKAQERLRKLNWPFGLGGWLEENAPSIYHALYVDLPNEIDRLWDPRVCTKEFQAALERWVELHREAVTLYRRTCEE